MLVGSKIPFQKIGTVFQNPAWRYEALRDPYKYRLKKFLSREGPNSGHLHRMLVQGIEKEVNCKYPPYLEELLTVLPTDTSSVVRNLWERRQKKSGVKKLSCGNTVGDEKVIAWNLRSLSSINDEFFHRAILHCVGDKTYPEIGFAIRLKKTPELMETYSSLGYMFYAGLSDSEIAKKWGIAIKRIEAIRMLFFDFSHFPKDRIATWAVLNQLKSSKIIDEVDFAYYKRIYDLGELGLKAQIDYIQLTEEEKQRVNDYLGSSMVVNTLNLNLGIANAKDSMNYTRVVTDFARLSIEKEDLKQRQTQTELVKMRIRQLSQESNLEVSNITKEDELIMEELHKLSLNDCDNVPFISITDLK